MIKKWFRALFVKKKQINKEDFLIENSLDSKITNAIKNCKSQIKQADFEIAQIKKWAADAIRNVFEVSSRYWYNEISEYEMIKKQFANKNVNPELSTNCDEIINGYLEQIELRKSTIDFCTKLLNEYVETENKLINTKRKISNQMNKEEKLKELQKHRERLHDMNDSSANFENTFVDNERLKILKQEIISLETNLDEKVEIYQQLIELTRKFSEVKPDNTKNFRQEIDKLKEKF
jgi:hypothetical protein